MENKNIDRSYSVATLKDVNSISFSHSIETILYVLLSRIALNLAAIVDVLKGEE